jgi:DNA polymerase-3 subunit beta
MPFSEAPAKLNAPPENTWTRIQIADLRRLLGSCRHAISNDATRVVNAALFSLKNKTMNTVGTDGHRLMVATATDPEHKGQSTDCLIPLLSFPHLLRLLEWAQQYAANEEESFVNIAFEAGRMFVISTIGTYSTKLRDGDFPPYEQVIPDQKRDGRVRTRVSREGLASAIKAVRVSAGKTGIDLVIGNGMVTLQVKDPEFGEATDEVVGDYLGEKKVVRVEGSYILDVLDAIRSDDVILSCGSDLDPVVILPTHTEGVAPHMDHTAVIMPMRR